MLSRSLLAKQKGRLPDRLAKDDKGAVAARAAAPRSRHALFDDSAAEIGIDKSTLDTRNRLAQRRVCDPLALGVTCEPTGLEDAHTLSITRKTIAL